MNPEKEFRVFIYDGKVTAISQQHIYDENNWLSSLSEKDIHEIILKIVSFYEKEVNPKIIQKNMVMDCALLGEGNEPYFIEPNVFGKEYASGSALFHWIDDEKIIYNPHTLYFRYIPSINKN